MAKSVKAIRSNLAKVREHFKQTGGGGDDRWFNIKPASQGGEAKAQIRVLPPWSKKAEGFFYYTEAQHFGFTIGGRQRALSCPESVNKGYPCPVCKFIARLKNSGEADHDKLQMRIRGNRRYFINVIDRAEPDKIKIYGTNKKFIETILDASDDEDMGDITDPKTGRDIVIIRKGAGLKTRYSYRIRLKSTPVEFDRAAMYQLDKDVPNWMTYDQMVEAILDNYAEEVKEVGLKFGKSSKKDKKNERHIQDDEHEDDDTEDEEEIEEDEEEVEDEESEEDDTEEYDEDEDEE